MLPSWLGTRQWLHRAGGGPSGSPCRGEDRKRQEGPGKMHIRESQEGRERAGGTMGALGTRPGSPACSCLGVHKAGSVYRWPWSQWEGVLPPGRGSRQTGSVALKDPVVSLCGRPPLPWQERCPGRFLPPQGLIASPAGLPREQPGSVHKGHHELKLALQEPLTVTKGDNQGQAAKTAPPCALWLPEQGSPTSGRG